jgi:hypothetical protein
MVGSAGGSDNRRMPRSVLVAASVVILFLALLALEISVGWVRHGGAIARSLFVFPLVLVLLWGILTHRRWAWLAARGSALLCALIFSGVGVLACILQPGDQYGAVWVWIATVSFVLASILSAGFFALGLRSAKAHYRLDCPECRRGISGLRGYFAPRATCRGCGHVW